MLAHTVKLLASKADHYGPYVQSMLADVTKLAELLEQRPDDSGVQHTFELALSYLEFVDPKYDASKLDKIRSRLIARETAEHIRRLAWIDVHGDAKGYWEQRRQEYEAQQAARLAELREM